MQTKTELTLEQTQQVVSDEVLKDSILQARNHVKEIILKLNLPDPWSVLTDLKIHIKMDMEVPNLFDVVCAKKKLEENERPLLEQTVNIVTQPSDNVINLGVVLLNQVPPVAALPLPTNVRKRSLVQAPALESADKKGKSVGSSSSGAHMTRDPASKAEEFILGITAAAPKRLTAKGKKPGDDIK
ncbi:hypothetical protein Tco_1302258 [Tanacetum coccineum]